MGTPLGPKYIPYTYMDPLGWCTGSARCDVAALARSKSVPYKHPTTRYKQKQATASIVSLYNHPRSFSHTCARSLETFEGISCNILKSGMTN